MSIRVRIDFSVSFFYKVFYKGICLKIQQEKTTRRRDLIRFVDFPHFIRLLHYLTVEFKVLRGWIF